MVIAIAQINYHIGNFAKNTEKILNTIAKAKNAGVELVVFPEIAVGGYLAKDLLRYDSFLDACEASVDQIAAACEGIACVIGAPVRSKLPKGKQLYNAALFLAEGSVQHVVHKTLLPDYDVFDEYRYFEPNDVFKCIDYKGSRIALTICEDLWNEYLPSLYAQDPMAVLAKQEPDIMINIAASPFSEDHFESRCAVVTAHSRRYGLPALYVNTIGAHADIIFDGRSLVFDQQAQLIDVLNPFQEDLRYYHLAGKELRGTEPAEVYKEPLSIANIYQALVLGIKDFFSKSGFKKAVLGLSGGIDSAVVAALASEALGPSNVMGVLMPSVYSSGHSVQDALDLARNLGCLHEVIPIKDATEAFDRMMAQAFAGKENDITEENIQARVRAIVLMAMSNKHGYILLNTSNKSEAAVGYGTLYGDMAGSLGVLGDVFKTKVYQLANYINRNGIIIPENTITKAPSAELRPDQKDSDSLPDYDVLDAILHRYIELERSAKEIIGDGFDKALVHRVIKLVVGAEFKRFQSPPILRVTRKAFGAGRAMPLVAQHPF
ncbi:NAD+ synthase [Olivibacter sp. XZL3]|uniref:NAD+ synthase n=1 Tax=Olivibacter sp. XZL3 TaxID=1735116 RepID=UPI001065FAA3|nr:NAD+ synthase [Olivibacter sp. XZL3]